MEPDHDQLPFLVVHGAWVWKALVVITAIGVLVARWRLRVRRARREARADVAQALRRAVTSLAAGPVVVRGTLVTNERGEPFAIETADGRIEIAGPVTVRRGPVAAGDEVLVEGTLESHAGDADGSAGYRDSAGAWRIHGDGDGDAPVAVLAAQPATPAAPLGWARAVVTLAVTAFGTWFALRLAGAYFAEEADELRISDHEPVHVGSFDATAIAAALPGSRDKALAQLHRRLWWQRARDARSMAKLLAVADLREGCRGVARTLHEYERFDEAAEVARRCGDHRLEWSAHLARGDHEGALAVLPAIGEVPSHEHVIAAIASGRWSDAAEAADRYAHEASAVGNGDSGVWARERSAGATCLAELFRHHAGDPDAAARLRAAPTQTGMCWKARTQVESEELLGPQHDDMFSSHYSVLKALDGSRKPPAWAWAAPWVPETEPFADSWLAYLAVVRGDLDAARAHARDAMAAASGAGEDVEVRARGLVSALELRGSRVDLELIWSERLAPALAVRRGGAVQSNMLLADDEECTVGFADALAQARDGDGGPLATTLERCDVSWIGDAPSFVLAVLPRVHTGRERLAAVLPWWQSQEPPSLGDHPFSLLHRAALRRDMLRLVGADDEAARLQAIIDRHLAVLADRERTIALILWHEL